MSYFINKLKKIFINNRKSLISITNSLKCMKNFFKNMCKVLINKHNL